ncbi:MAG TPA: amino acid permease [Acidimicrobiales bacterium]|nr:amino acid permease [Acidimicrobiales bacterium]
MDAPGTGENGADTRSEAVAGPAGPVGSVQARARPSATPTIAIDVPETLRYRLKNVLLGPPLVNEQLSSERLSRPSALGVLAPDCISSSAYGTEQMLTQMVPFVGLAAFTLVVPITFAILGVLFFVTLSYLEVIQLYTKAGGAYVVARENFGPNIAQIAAVALLIDYTVTVAVQSAAGTAALSSAFPRLVPYTVPITIGVVVLLLYGNLRGIREAGRFFAFPTYFFIASLAAVVIVGYVREITGTLHVQSVQHVGTLPIGHSGSGLLYGASFIIILRSFANGGSSLTGLEAISNGVGAFRRPTARNARQVLVIMSSVLAFLVLGVTLIAHWTHAVPYAAGSPTVVSQEVGYVLGSGPVGKFLFYVVQFATVMILYTGANTSFNGFPFLASFVAEDSFLPRQLTRRGHRLVFSNGIIVLTVVAVVLLLVTRAKVNNLVALYAIGVFTGFTMAGAGMVKHHLDGKGAHWRRSVAINGFSAFLTATIVLIFATVKFTEGAWVVVIAGPLMYWGLIRLHRQYVDEEHQLEEGASEAAEAPVLSRHNVIVLIDRLDMATARAIQYARTLHPDEIRAVHFLLDDREAAALEAEWGRLGLAGLPLDVIECEDRRLTRAALELAAETVADNTTELTMLLPRRGFEAGWHRLLHDGTADRIAASVSQLPHVNVSVVPYQLTGGWLSRRREWRRGRAPAPGPEPATGQSTKASARAADRVAVREATKPAFDRAAFGDQGRGTMPIGEVQWRTRVRVAGKIRSVRVQPRAGTSNLECVLTDGTGNLFLVFQGRRRIPGVQPGARLVVEGMVGDWGHHQAILNPDYELIAGPDAGEDSS